jgi:biopolymer transport protein ExbD
MFIGQIKPTSKLARKIASAHSNSFGFGMADMAFVLLTFFMLLMIPADEMGFKMRLEPLNGEMPIFAGRVQRHNIFNIVLHDRQFEIDGEAVPRSLLKYRLSQFVSNPTKSREFADNPWQARVYFGFDCETTYQEYMSVISDVKSVYWKLWERESMSRFDKSYQRLTPVEKRYIRGLIPFNLGEHFFYCGD